MAFNDQGLSARAIPLKMEKILRCNIEFSSIERGLWTKEISKASVKAIEKGKRNNYEKKEQWENNFTQNYKRSSDSGVKKYFVQNAQ